MNEFEVVLVEPINGARVLTPWVTDLSFRSVDPGGYGSVTFNLSRSVAARDFERRSEVLVYDASSGEQVAGAWILNPGRSITEKGSVWQVSALGAGQAHLQEREVPYHIIDTRLDPWNPGSVSNARLEWRQGEKPDSPWETDAAPGWTFVISPGELNDGNHGRLNYYDMEQYAEVSDEFRIEIGGYAFRDVEGNGTDANRVQSLISSPEGTSSQEIVTDFGFDVPPGAGPPLSIGEGPHIRRREVGVDWDSGGVGTGNDEPVTRLTIRYLRNGDAPAPGVGGEDDWMHVWDLRVSSLRLDRDGEPIIAAGTYASDDTSSDYVLAHEAVIDCWARFCPMIDLPNAVIDETATYQHRDLVWPEGVNPYKVMEKLMEFEPSFTWGLWEKNPNGGYRAEWRQRDTEVRYEMVNVLDFVDTSIDATALEDVYVVGQTEDGHLLISRTNDADPPAFGPSRTIKHESKKNDEDFATAASAVGQEEMDGSVLSAASAQATVSQMVYDHRTGRWIQPYMVLPGYLCRIPGVRSRVDTLNPRSNDLATVFRIVSNEYTVDSGVSRFDLNSYTQDEARSLANLLHDAA